MRVEGPLQWGSTVGEKDCLNSKYKKKWRFMVETQGEVSGYKIAKRKHQE